MKGKSIYITVCFYLNQILSIKDITDYDLHYSMFLFKRTIRNEQSLRDEIYITVCFYLNF